MKVKVAYGLVVCLIAMMAGPSCENRSTETDKHHNSTGGAKAVELDIGGAETGGAATGGAETGGAATGGAETGGAATGGAKTGGAATGGAESGTCPNIIMPGAANIDLFAEYQTISGYGGINVPGWLDDLTTEQVDKAFGNAPDQMGLSILRVRVPHDLNLFSLEVPTAARAVSYGAKVLASPWSPPAYLKTNNNLVAGHLSPESYGAYAEHLLSFRDYMQTNGAPVYAISVQNEPDCNVSYESCDWSPIEMIAWLIDQGPKFGDTKLVAAESYNFNRTFTDPILNNPTAAAHVDIIGGHIYGYGLFDYPLARTLGKEVWMTEHYTDSHNSANLWSSALIVGKEIHDCMMANFNAYIWWYIRRSYGLITEDGNISKRGYILAQYAKFIRPGYVRIDASAPSNAKIFISAYKNGSQVVVVAVNLDVTSQTVTFNVQNTCIEHLTKYTTSESKNISNDGVIALTNNSAFITLDAESVSTFVSN